jgi:hypothetical protein
VFSILSSATEAVPAAIAQGDKYRLGWVLRVRCSGLFAVDLRRVSRWLLRSVLLPKRLLSLESTFDRLVVTSLLNGRRYYLYRSLYIGASLLNVLSIAYIGRGNALLSLSLAYMHTNLLLLL